MPFHLYRPGGTRVKFTGTSPALRRRSPYAASWPARIPGIASRTAAAARTGKTPRPEQAVPRLPFPGRFPNFKPSGSCPAGPYRPRGVRLPRRAPPPFLRELMPQGAKLRVLQEAQGTPRPAQPGSERLPPPPAHASGSPHSGRRCTPARNGGFTRRVPGVRIYCIMKFRICKGKCQFFIKIRAGEGPVPPG